MATTANAVWTNTDRIIYFGNNELAVGTSNSNNYFNPGYYYSAPPGTTYGSAAAQTSWVSTGPNFQVDELETWVL